MAVSPAERELGIFLRDLPRNFNHRYTKDAELQLRERLFRSLAGNNDGNLGLLFPSGPPSPGQPWSLRDAQGAVDGAEYTAAARGHACGHIFKAGESTYHCKTCAADDTCVLCARCFEESDHEGHMVYISVSPGNSGCCDCADDEAWVRPVHCSIHSADGASTSQQKGKTSEPSALPDHLVDLIHMTIAKTFDYLCDVFSCSPEQLRLPKTEDSVKADELLSRLTSDLYGGPEVMESDEEYALVLWNDEKHTVTDVQNQVARACKNTKTFGFERAMEVNDIGRSVLHYSKDVKELLNMATIIEQLKVSVTVRSARDTFREQMCATIVDWISDISGCSYGSDPLILRNTVCQELLRPWRMGSEAINHGVGQKGIDDHEHEDNVRERRANARWFRPMAAINVVRIDIEPAFDGDDDEDDDDEDDEDDEFILEEEMDEAMNDGEDEQEAMEVDDDPANFVVLPEDRLDLDMDTEGPGEIFEATHAGYPPPPAPPARRARDATPNESDESELPRTSQSSTPFSNLPKTPRHKVRPPRPPRPAKHWLEVPDEYKSRQANSPEENLWQRVRLDYLILYDLRLWKTLRVDLRHLYISTVVTVPQFKRILGLRFAGLYTMLAQLYLIADREPDHSIINLSVQMLTTPSITAEVVERGNFLTNLMAILYTFLTTRQVGFPSDVNPTATLAFDQGAVTNRRMFHFFVDTRYMFQSSFVQEKVRMEQRYLLQFLDLVKLHQGICPNVRAVGEHVEYEADAWISASMIIKEVNRLCRQVAESFKSIENSDFTPIQRAIRHTAQATFVNAFGDERNRFTNTETKHAERFHRDNIRRRTRTSPMSRCEAMGIDGVYGLPSFEVAKGAMSFHHPLHYLLSWLLEAGKIMTRTEMLRVLHFDESDQRDPWTPNWKPASPNGPYKPDEVICMLFEHPLRVCTWLAQMRAGMWVRNGITLRHQMHTYRGTSQRDVSFQRDILLLQAGLVLCGNEEESLGERFLAQIIDRFAVKDWVDGNFDLPECHDDQQRLDVTEEFYHLLVVLLSERQNLVPGSDNADSHVKAIQRDIAHVLCFKPLSFSDISARLTDRVGDSEDFDSILEDMTKFRSPEGLNDSGTFELLPEFIEVIDPYYAYYNRNQREESETIYREYMAKKTGRPAADIVFEPKLPTISSGLFSHLGAFTQTALFSDVISNGLKFALKALKDDPESSQLTKVEALVHIILHLTLLAVSEDTTPGGSKPKDTEDSFVRLAIYASAFSYPPASASPADTILGRLLALLEAREFASCAPKIRLIMDRMSEKRPEGFAEAKSWFAPSEQPSANDSSSTANADAKELKKKQALERQAKVMASFKAQQNSFMANQGLDWEGDDFSDVDEDMERSLHTAPEEMTWEFPTGSCMLCQEETNDRQLYGTFAFMGPSKIFRQTPVNDVDFVEEVVQTPLSLDRNAEDIRPFGVASSGKEFVQKTTSDGNVSVHERQGLSKGFPRGQSGEGPVVTSCGHLMHFSCFETYMTATQRRHATQIARNHPERPDSKEFLCPLCKALGNTFLPILWKDKQYGFPGVLAKADERSDFDNWLKHIGPQDLLEAAQLPPVYNSWRQGHVDYMQQTLSATLSSTLPQLRQSSPSAEISEPDNMSDDFSTHEPPLERSRAAIPELVQRAAIELGLAPRPPNLEQREQQNRPPAHELRLAFTRIEKGLRPNGVIGPDAAILEPGTQSSGVQTSETLTKALAASISSIEIAHRGIAPAEGIVNTTLLDAIPDQAMTTLKILSETVSSVTAQAATRPLPLPGAEARVHKSWYNQLMYLLGERVGEDSFFSGQSLLENDMFAFFTGCTLNMLPMGDDMHHILRLCFSAELMKVLLTYLGRQSYDQVKPNPAGERWLHKIEEPVASFQRWIIDNQQWLAGIGDNEAGFPNATSARTTTNYGLEVDIAHPIPWPQISLHGDSAAVMETLVDRYALTFLRKALILLHVRFGVNFSATSDDPADPNSPELHRLAHLLRLPLPSEIFQQLGAPTSAGEALRRHVGRWAVSATSGPPFQVLRPLAQSLSHPAIFELIGLPKNYDTLTEEAIKRRCPTTGKEVTDPAICLFCGEIFCSQAGCCMRDKSKGGCYQHREKCGGNIGVFISIRKCMVLFLHNGHGSWFHAPYLDRHGEVDPTLRRHHQLFLNQKRYDKLIREAWLGHGIQSVISRRLEGEMNTGGWETL